MMRGGGRRDASDGTGGAEEETRRATRLDAGAGRERRGAASDGLAPSTARLGLGLLPLAASVRVPVRLPVCQRVERTAAAAAWPCSSSSAQAGRQRQPAGRPLATHAACRRGAAGVIVRARPRAMPHGHVTRTQDTEDLSYPADVSAEPAAQPSTLLSSLSTPQTLLSEPFGLRAELQLSSPGRAVIGIAEDLNHFLLGVTNHCSIHFDDCKTALCGRRHRLARHHKFFRIGEKRGERLCLVWM